MHTIDRGDSLEYTYELRPGISTVNGGIRVLRDMGYPPEILDWVRAWKMGGKTGSGSGADTDTKNE